MPARDYWFYLLSLPGAALSAYVWLSQRSGRPILCWTRHCDRIIQSPYARLFGVHNSALGFWLFLLIFFLNLWRQLGFDRRPEITSAAVILLSFGGTLISLYLAYVQLFVLKGICQWCFASAGLVSAILLLALFG